MPDIDDLQAGDRALAMPGDSPASVFCAATKHSVTVAGHQTSIRIESPYWDSLLAAAAIRGLPVNALVARIDAARLLSDNPPNLASAIRLWLFTVK